MIHICRCLFKLIHCAAIVLLAYCSAIFGGVMVPMIMWSALPAACEGVGNQAIGMHKLDMCAAMESVSAKQGNSSDCDSSSSDGSDSNGDQAHTLQWPSAAVDLLLYTLTNDPSIRARRAAMKALQAARVHAAPHACLRSCYQSTAMCSPLALFTKRFNGTRQPSDACLACA